MNYAFGVYKIDVHLKLSHSCAASSSMIAYFLAQYSDVKIFHFIKKLTKGKHLWLRNNASTLVSQLIDTICVISITHFLSKSIPLPEGKSEF